MCTGARRSQSSALKVAERADGGDPGDSNTERFRIPNGALTQQRYRNIVILVHSATTFAVGVRASPAEGKVLGAQCASCSG